MSGWVGGKEEREVRMCQQINCLLSFTQDFEELKRLLIKRGEHCLVFHLCVLELPCIVVCPVLYV